MKLFLILGSLLLSVPAFAGFWCNGSGTSLHCNDPAGGYWCTGSATSKLCRPSGRSAFWCSGGSPTSILCRPSGRPAYWCTGGSANALYCRDGN
jgi:hypothetical protein